MPRRSPRSRIEAAVDGANEPAITAARRWSRRTGSGSRPRLQSIAARRLRWRAGTDASMSGSAAGVDDLRVELVEQLVRGQHAEGRRGELDRERDAVEAAADGADEREVGRGGLEVRADDERPLEEQLRGRVRAHGVADPARPPPGTAAARATATCSRGTRSVRRLVTTIAEAGRPGLEVGERRGGGPDVLGRVEDEEGGRPAQLVGERLGQRLVERAAGLVGDADRARDRRQHERRVADAVQRHERDPAVPQPEVLGGQLRGEAALAHPADPGQRDERRGGVAGEPAQLGEVGVAADERGRRALGRGRWPARAHVRRAVVATIRGVVDGGGELGSGRVSRRVRQGPEHTPGTGTAGSG